MIKFLQKKTRNAIVIYLAIAVMGIGLLSVGLMHHDNSMMEELQSSVVCSSSDCGSPVNDFTCVGHCLIAANNFSQAMPINAGLRQALLLAVSLFFGLFLYLFFSLLSNHRLSKSRLRELCDDSVFSFFHQIGFWLTLFSKRDPSYSFVLA